MVADCNLKENTLYYIEVTNSSHPCFGKQYIALFTGIPFRNVEYLKTTSFDWINDDREAVRKKLKDRKAGRPDEYFLLSDIKVYREAQPELFNTHQ